jgi:hypothetical protein
MYLWAYATTRYDTNINAAIIFSVKTILELNESEISGLDCFNPKKRTLRIYWIVPRVMLHDVVVVMTMISISIKVM